MFVFVADKLLRNNNFRCVPIVFTSHNLPNRSNTLLKIAEYQIVSLLNHPNYDTTRFSTSLSATNSRFAYNTYMLLNATARLTNALPPITITIYASNIHNKIRFLLIVLNGKSK